MPTYYVANYGSNTNNGTTAATPWATVAFALGAASGTNPGLVAGDTVWIAPGTYREVITSTTLTGTSGNTIKIYGDPKFTQSWSAGSAGRVRLTNYSSDTVVPTGSQTLAIIGDYVEIQDICFDGNPTGTIADNVITEACLFLRGGNITVTRCTVQTTANLRQLGIECFMATGKNNLTIDRCSIFAPFGILVISGTQTATYDVNTVVKDSLIIGGLQNPDAAFLIKGSASSQVTGLRFYNNTILSQNQAVNLFDFSQVGGTTTVVRNNLIYSVKGTGFVSNSSITITQSNNTIFAATNFQNISPTTNNVSAPMLDSGSSRIQAFGFLPWHAPMAGSPLISAGTATGAPTIDLYSNTWTSTPTVGAIESRSESATLVYQPTERNASTITIAPGLTSQSIELYLGATGLTASTSGLSARYNRTRTASVSIPLVARTIAQAWTSGGFAEVDATNMPGVYRLDVPDAALAAGADDVTVVVRGASGTNGAVMTVKLSSGGLTEAQTASAVWGASVAGYSGASTFGGIVTETSSVVNGIDGEVQDIPSNVWEELRANHDTVGTFGQYVNAELVTPVTSAALVRMGPFEVRADGLGASDPLDIQKGAQHGIDIQCVDNNNAGIDITSATVTAKVYNSGATLVDTYSCTATYAADGRATFTIDTTVTNVPGTYTATITRTTGASDTQIFGPLRIYVRDI
jgi:hypothetical protein